MQKFYLTGAMIDNLEALACQPYPLHPHGFNPKANLPYGCTTEHIQLAMKEFIDFLGFLNQQLYTKELHRLEAMLMPATFSSLVGEFMVSSIPKYCACLVKNQYQNGHPDLIPAGMFPNNATPHAKEGIHIKGSRYKTAWQGYNSEELWLIVFIFDSNRPADAAQGIQPRPFRFVKVIGAYLTKNDWTFSGQESSRRSISANVKSSGYQKMIANWIYQDPGLL
jgi:hypothetical protein